MATQIAAVRPAGDLGNEEHLAGGIDRFVERVLVDLAVDRHGHALFEMTSDIGVAFGQKLEQVLHRFRRQVELGNPAREMGEVADEYDPRHDVPISGASSGLRSTSSRWRAC